VLLRSASVITQFLIPFADLNALKILSPSWDSTSKKRQGKRDPLAPYRPQAQRIIKLYFGKDTPDFVRDLLGSFLNNMENETQVFWNKKEIREVALPLMLRELDRNGVDLEDIESRYSSAALSAFHDSLDCTDTGGEYPFTAHGMVNSESGEKSEDEKLLDELLVDAQAISRIVHSKHTPPLLRSRLLESLDEIRIADDAPEVIRVAYPLAVLRLQEAEGATTEATTG
jgi:hypothetical protein